MFVAKWYTRASRVRIVIAKFDGRWKIPGGPYPIPELVALVGGVLTTLMLLPRLGHPVVTAAVGVSITAALVAAMRRMSYSPVKLSTRIHRVARLYTSPSSLSTSLMDAVDTCSTVCPQITFINGTAVEREPLVAHHPGRTPRSRGGAGEGDRWSALFDGQRSTAADLLGS